MKLRKLLINNFKLFEGKNTKLYCSNVKNT